MPAALPAALFLLAQSAVAAPAPNASAYGPTAPTPAAAPPKAAAESCPTQQASASTREIVICAQRPNGYRLDPDVMAARQHKRQQFAGRPKTPMEKMSDNRCAIGPQGCVSAGINLIGAALTAAEMAKRLASGQEIGSMFETDKQPGEYQLYVEAKREREAREAEKKATLAKAKAQQSAAAAAAAATNTAPAPAAPPAQR